MGTVGEDGDNQSLCLGTKASGSSLKTCRQPVGIALMRAGHVIGIGAVAPALITTLMAGDAPAFVKDLDDPAGHAHIDLSTDQAVGHGIEELLDLDVVVETDPGELPDGKLVVFGR